VGAIDPTALEGTTPSAHRPARIFLEEREAMTPRRGTDDTAPPRWVRPLLAVLAGMLLGQLAFDGLTGLTLVGGAALLLAALGTRSRPQR
jgi:hypothetical protein